MKLNVRLLGVYMLCLSLSLLAGIYFGPALLFVFIFLLALPLTFIALTLLPFSGIQVEQRWEDAMPVRGETTSVSIDVANASPFPAHGLSLNVENPQSDRKQGVDQSHSLHLPARFLHTMRLVMRYAHRGVYRLGVRSVGMSDPLGLLKLERKFELQEFIVYPKLYELHAFSTVIEDILGHAGGRNGHGPEDPSLFVQLREYREGESIRHISWRKYASTGKPYLREFERQQRNGAVVYLDSRSGNGSDPREQEDASIEIFIAIMRYLLSSSVPVTARVPGNPDFEREVESGSDLDRMLEAAVRARFSRSNDLVTTLPADARAGMFDRKIVIVVSHHFDAGLRTALEGNSIGDLRLVMNLSGMDARDQEEVRSEVAGSFGEHAEVYLIVSPQRMAAVLEAQGSEAGAGLR
ncbi:MAG TPA: DUF58 domain-containing protein [Spirochaetia bacterium]|nr:DUF58 domain-containing protein [Spirochaetia bacterium]